MPFAREYGLVPLLQAEESDIMGKGRDQRCCSGRLEWKKKNWANSTGLLEFPRAQEKVSIGNLGEALRRKVEQVRL